VAFFTADLQPASARSLAAPGGSGEALTISSHPSRAAAPITAGLPLAALSQIVSSLRLVFCGSVGSTLTPLLHRCTAADESFPGPVVVVGLGVVAPPVAVEDVELVAAVLLELLLELPQPTNSAAQASATSGAEESLRIIDMPAG
jgi:hypothetical protein